MLEVLRLAGNDKRPASSLPVSSEERIKTVPVDPDRRRNPPANTRAEIAKQVRLWLLTLICATAGAAVVWRTGAVLRGVSAFLITLAVLGPCLWAYERRKR